jgi:DNA-binding CsgD family transcriptional regulator
MMTGYQALTEKEKEALRLLVSGYDAKSTATQLGLSVHTINERLRDARRKMSVSSSREAARLVREVERKHPEFLGDEPLGDVSPTQSMPSPISPDAASRNSRPFAWVIGGLVMSISFALLAYISLADNPQAPAVALPSPVQAAESASVQAARQWLALVDKSDWNESWNSTGQAFKSLNTNDRWAEVSNKVRTPLGTVRSRELSTEDYVPAPPYGYQMVRFKTSFANKPAAVESLSLVRENDSWKVVGYIIE